LGGRGGFISRHRRERRERKEGIGRNEEREGWVAYNKWISYVL